MNKIVSILLTASLALTVAVSCSNNKGHDYPYSPVAFTSVSVTDSFWGQRLKASREVTIPLAFSKCEETGRYQNFVEAAQQMHSDVNLGFDVTKGRPFDDTDVYKTIEGASYILQTYPDPALEAYIDSVLVLVAAAQEPDGYLYTQRTRNPEMQHRWAGKERWVQIEDSHELYDLGHMVEGAIAHYRATGKRNFLDIALGYADCVCREIGPGPDQQVRVPGHQIAEMALAKLYTVTGDKKYLDEAKFFIDMRSHGERGAEEYRQSHVPVLQQEEAVGHAVRAEYFYSGIADVAALTGDKDYIKTIDKIWNNIVGKKIYLTGGVGARRDGEAFGEDYQLPNLTAYCETCAAIGNVYFNYRMFLLHGDAKYYDVLERTLYNGVLSGDALDGGTFFYPNPLESDGSHARRPWFGTSCCPSNLCRFIPSVPGYVYATKGNDLYVNLYMSNNMAVDLKSGKVSVSMDTNYPWDGDVVLTVNEAPKSGFNLKLRIPGWVRNEVLPTDLYHYADDVNLGYKVMVNGKEVSAKLDKGYFSINRKWQKGDKVSIEMEMQPRVVEANILVEDDEDRFAFEKGPIVYCAEWPDNPGKEVRKVVLSKTPQLSVERRPDLLYGIDEIKVNDSDLTLIPYYAWCHRGSGDMIVWMKHE